MKSKYHTYLDVVANFKLSLEIVSRGNAFEMLPKLTYVLKSGPVRISVDQIQNSSQFW